MSAPPHARYAVIFKSKPAKLDQDFHDTSDQLDALVLSQPGFLGMDSVHDAEGVGITISYWESLEAIRAWKAHPLHQTAQRKGHERWFASYQIEIVEIHRQYQFERNA